MITNSAKTKGFTVIETMFYLAIFVILSIVVVNSLIVMTRSYRETAIFRELSAAGNIMESISREIKQAESINTLSATSLKLNTLDSEGAPKTTTIDLSDSNVRFLENDTFVANLNSPTVVATALSFTEITTVEGKAVKVGLSLRTTKDDSARVYDFYNTVVLRRNY